MFSPGSYPGNRLPSFTLETSCLGKGFCFRCLNRPVPRDSLNPYNLSLVEDWGMYWTPSKHKLIAELHSKQNVNNIPK